MFEMRQDLQTSGSRNRGTLFLLTLVAVIVGWACSPSQPPSSDPARSDGKTVTGGEPFHGLLPYRARDAKLALVRPSFVGAEEAALADGVSVVGVSIDGVHRAYPLYVLKNHQVVNDRLGEVPVAASW